MIKGLHAMFYSANAEADRAFLRDILELPYFDAGEGWLIFKAPAGEIGCHPHDSTCQDFSFYCDDLESTVQTLTAKGVEFIRDIRDDGFGWTTEFKMPGGQAVMLYQAKY